MDKTFLKKDLNVFKLSAKKISCLLRGFAFCGPNVYVSPLAECRQPGAIRLSEGVVVERYARLNANGKGASVSIGEYTTVCPYALLKCNGGAISIGELCAINDYAILYGNGNITMGNDVHIASHAVLVASQHDYRKLGDLSFSQQMEARGIIIEDSVWIGSHAVVLDGVKLEKGAVIGAGAVVTRDVPAYSVAVGVPARVIKQWKS